jgi:hypothetical protein
MDIDTFIDHFTLVLVHLNSFTSQLCFNELSTNYSFLLDEDGWSVGEEFTDEENNFIIACQQYRGQNLTFQQIVDLLYSKHKCVKWANCQVYSSTLDKTVVKIEFSKEFVDECEVYYLERGTGPFKAVVAIPPDHLKIMIGDRFDVNWQVQ